MAVALCGVSAFAQEPSQAPTSGQIKAGAELYATNCSPCHGVRLDGTEMAFDLRKFPPGQRERFVTSVTRGKNQMPPWGDFFKPEGPGLSDLRVVDVVRTAQSCREGFWCWYDQNARTLGQA